MHYLYEYEDTSQSGKGDPQTQAMATGYAAPPLTTAGP
jgi:hypothetical protein